jgi:hypothetical protein
VIRWVGVAVVLVAAGALLLMVVQLASNTSTDAADLDVGDCFDLDLDAEGGAGFVDLGLVDVIACTEPHNAQVVAIGELNPDGDEPFPGDDELFAQAAAVCDPAAATDVRFGMLPVTPTEATWDARRGRYSCVAVSFGGAPVTGDHAAIAADP